MASRPAFASKLMRSEIVRLSAASTSRDGSSTTNIVQCFQAPAGGSRVEAVEIQALGNTTAGAIRVFSVNGATYRLRREVLVPAVTINLATGIGPWFDDSIRSAIGDPLPAFLLKANEWLYVATHNAESFDVCIWGGDF